jgi:hypothetical protein
MAEGGVEIEELGEDDGEGMHTKRADRRQEDEQQTRIEVMLAFLDDPKVIVVMSTLIAKMERPIFDDTRTTIFRTAWGKRYFSEIASGMMGEPFDIDSWYRSHARVHQRTTRRDIDAAVYLQPIETDWMSALMELEVAATSRSNGRCTNLRFLKVLYSTLEIEDQAHDILATLCKKERQYDLIGVSRPSVAGSQKLLAAPPVPKPGSVEDLLESSKKKK